MLELCHGFSRELTTTCALQIEDSFDYLDAPIERVCGADVPMPYAVNLEQFALPEPHNIVTAVLKTLGK